MLTNKELSILRRTMNAVQHYGPTGDEAFPGSAQF
jgi:hypothetical protein